MRRFRKICRAFSIPWEADALSAAGVRLGRDADRLGRRARRVYSGRVPRPRAAGARRSARESRHRSGAERCAVVRDSRARGGRIRPGRGALPVAFPRARSPNPVVSGRRGDARRPSRRRPCSRHRQRKEPCGPRAGAGQYGSAALVRRFALRRPMRVEACARHASRAHGGAGHGRGEYPYDRRHGARSSDGGKRRSAGGRGESWGAPQGRPGRARAACLPGEHRRVDAMARTERIICLSADLTDSGDGVRFELEVDGKPEPAFAVRYGGRGFAYLTFLLLLVLDWRRQDGFTSGKHTALVDVVGVIDPKGDASADRITESLQNAFKNKNTQGVILRINSPGGSPVQAGIIYDEIRRLRGIYPNVPMYAVVEDICASGGYYIAAAADKIYVDKASIIGSIGVIMDGWGFTGTMEKLGVERRALTSGENKAFLDPFLPVDEKQKRHAQSMLDDIHKQFIDVVRKGRGKRLKESPDIFSGLLWTGAKSVELGLSDGFGSVDFVAREVIKAEEALDYTKKQDFSERFAKRFGAAMTGALAKVLAQGSFNVR